MTRRARPPARMIALTTVLAATAASGFVALGTGPASAQGVQSVRAQIAAAQHQLNTLDNQAEAAAERYNEARIKLAGAQQSSAAAHAKLLVAQARVRSLQRSVTAFAVAAYRGDTSSSLIALTQGSTRQLLDRESALQAVSTSQAESLAEVTAANRAEQQAQAFATAALTAQRAATAAEQADRNQVLAAAAKEKTILGNLQAREAAIIAAARQAREAAKRKAAQIAAAEQAVAALRARQAAEVSAASAVSSQPVSQPVNPPAPVAGSGGASVAVQWAYREIGKPYVWGAAGPNSFDCSGLTMFAWAHAGVQLDHYTGAQWNEGTHVSQSQLEPGDLVFFGSDLHHVGMYIGGGNMIEAPYTGADVRISPYDRSDYAGAVRPG